MKEAYYNFIDHLMASYTGRILWEALQLLGELWPYLVGGIVLSTVVKVFVSRESMAGWFSDSKRGIPILLAALAGVVSPLGSYVVIPLSAALLASGVPLSVLMALMVSGPLINPNLFVLTAGAMGMEMALLRVFAALSLGLLAGYSTLWLERRSILNAGNVLREGKKYSLESVRGGQMERSPRGFFLELYRMTRYISRYFFLALLLAAALKILVNPKYIARLFENDNLMSVLLSTAAGVPFYACGGAAVPVVESLAEMGMSKGAALAYFISGPATKISNLVVMQAAFRWVILVLYLIIAIGGAIVFGLVYNLV